MDNRQFVKYQCVYLVNDELFTLVEFLVGFAMINHSFASNRYAFLFVLLGVVQVGTIVFLFLS